MSATVLTALVAREDGPCHLSRSLVGFSQLPRGGDKAEEKIKQQTKLSMQQPDFPSVVFLVPRF